MGYHTFYENETEIILDLSFGQYYRSSNSRKEIKHCIEFELIEQDTKSAEVGFSCVYNSRTFTGYYQFKKGILIMKDGESSFKDCHIKQDIGETVEVCYDSLTTELIIIKGNDKCTENVRLPNPITWFAYVDYGSSQSQGKISLNIGNQKFINPIPNGFEPWLTPKFKNICTNNMIQLRTLHLYYSFILLCIISL